MSQPAILHICVADKFIEPFIRFIDKHFESADHEFVYFGGDENKYPAINRANVWRCTGFIGVLRLIGRMQGAQKIIIHGLFIFNLFKILALQPWVLKKCYWVMWGGDLYLYQFRPRSFRSDLQERIRHFVIKRIGHFITQVKGDYELVQKWYGVRGQWSECFMYPSNLYHEHPVKPTAHDTINILVGNSATETNNHLEVLDKLGAHAAEDIRIYCPLSYGEPAYAQKIADYGQSLFGEKFIALREFMPFEKYLELLAQIDIAIFNHNRQQGMGNITTLLGLGKKVYMRSDVTSWETFKQLGIRLYDVASIDLTRIDEDVARRNNMHISESFSEAALAKQIHEILK